MNRRGFLAGILALGAAPAIVRADSLMRVVARETVVDTGGLLMPAGMGRIETFRFVESPSLSGTATMASGMALSMEMVRRARRLLKETGIKSGSDGKYVFFVASRDSVAELRDSSAADGLQVVALTTGEPR